MAKHVAGGLWPILPLRERLLSIPNAHGAGTSLSIARRRAGVERERLSDEAVAEAGRRFARRLREQRTPKPASVAKVGALQTEVANIVQAIASGLNSPALSARLAAAESELARLQEAAPSRPRVDVAKLVPSIGDEYRRMVRKLAETIHETDPARGRAAIRELVGEVRVIADEWGIRLVSSHAGIEKAL